MYEICSQLTIKTPEQRLMSSFLPLSRFYTLFWCFHCCFEQIKCRLEDTSSFITKTDLLLHKVPLKT